MIDRSHWRWCVAGVLVFVPVYLAYVLTHEHPSLGGGLFLMMGEEIVAHGYTLPTRISHYTSGGIPFSYPPLMLFVVGFLLDIGAPPLALARLFPGVVVACALIVYAVAATELLQSRRQGAFAAIVVATAPSVLHLTLTAGGTVRAAALLFTSAGIYTGVRLFKTGSRTWLLASMGLFGATLLTHPLYTFFFGTSYLVLYVWLDRTVDGLLRGAVVAAGGIVLAAPWWLPVVSTHGFEVFLQAGSTHDGIGYLNWYQEFPTETVSVPSPWPPLAILSGLFLLVRRKPMLPSWFVVVGFLTGRDEFLLVIGAMMVAVSLFEGVVPLLRRIETTVLETIETRDGTALSACKRGAMRLRSNGPRGCVLAILILGLVTAYGTTSAAVYVAGGDADDELPMFVHGSDVTATEWVRSNTTENASFVVIGDVAEWFPLLTDRTNLVVPQGSEWEGTRDRQMHMRDQLRPCLDASCLTSRLDQFNLDPDYVYLTASGYARKDRQAGERRWTRLGRSLRQSPDYEVVFETKGTLIVRRR
ncbi:ArnT family glycosyltransferase [Halocatena pleomorpha]|uniref:Glycosyltransferase RgtA/B/C/D-like domain-containing protein n=1 Tax=Halocatena pleomorpha TaxID=1785090 RepID=A0A3P3RJG6_9EURY|nr:glycosyltransferase family 39 protein [Halocatena pleomorpha]RRJ33562.1 hypothetical protein EIK79_01815 [Halocatena pleomorpha]